MSKTNTWENDLQLLIFQNTAPANVDIGDASSLQPAATVGSLYVALFTNDPTEAGTGTESAYTNYARVAVARTSGGWTVSAGQASNTAVITFPTCGVTGSTVTHFGIFDLSTGGTMLYHGALSASKAIANGDTPEFGAGAITIQEN